MKIGLYISPAHSVPSNEQNILAPWALVGQLADGLVHLGHTVTLFAAKGSKTKANLASGDISPTIQKKPDFRDMDAYKAYVLAQELALMREAIIIAKAGKLDILHIHQPLEPLYPTLLAFPPKIPIILTFHDPITPNRFAALEKLNALGNIHFVSLSKSQQANTPFPFAGIVPNGVDTHIFKPADTSEIHDKPLLMTGRIVPQKGFIDGILAARSAGSRLLIVGQVYTNTQMAKDYFENDIRPHIDGKHVIWESLVKPDHLIGHYQTAKALLFPIHWEEPFGLVMIEAMSCGTPIIAYDHGSVSEIVRDGKTGFVIDETLGVDGLVQAIKKIEQIDRDACRSHVEAHFTIDRMIKGYETIYENIIRH